MPEDRPSIAAPYLLFLGDATDELHRKTAQGLAYWRPEHCCGLWHGGQPSGQDEPGKELFGLASMDPEQAVEHGVS